MDKVRVLLNWRGVVIAVEVLVAAGCFFAGWRLVAHRDGGGAVEVHRGAEAPPGDAPGFLGMPLAPGADAAAPRVGGLSLAPAADLLSRLNHDDLRMYRSQWQVIQVLIDGTRRYLELKVLPVLSAA